MNQKPLFLTVALTALLVIGGVFWLMQKRQVAISQPVVTDPIAETPVQTEPENLVDTTDWKTYRNDEFGFEVKFPKEWEIRSEHAVGNDSIELWFSEIGKWYEYEGGRENAIILQATSKNEYKGLPTENIMMQWQKYYQISYSKIEINGVMLYKYSGYGEGVKTADNTRLPYVFSLSSSLPLSQYPGVREVLQKIIQTITFR